MEAGKLRHRINLQTATVTRSTGYGGPLESWANTPTSAIWASVEPLMGSEAYRAQQTAADLTHRVVIRYRSGVAPKMRVVFGSRTFNIRAVRNIEGRGTKIEMLCEELNL